MQLAVGSRIMGHVTIASRTPAARQVRWHLGVGIEPALGAHLVTPRGAYSHHGIYVGKGKVVHYAGLARSLHRGPVEEVTMHAPPRGAKCGSSRAIARVTPIGKL